jgi:hypothetical protein
MQFVNYFLSEWNDLIGWYLSLPLFLYFVEIFCWLFNIYLRTSRSEFIVSVNKYLEARSHKLSVGMRFKMRFEGDEVPERRCTIWFWQLIFSFDHTVESDNCSSPPKYRFSGTIVGVGDNKSSVWADSEWRSLKVSMHGFGYNFQCISHF